MRATRNASELEATAGEPEEDEEAPDAPGYFIPGRGMLGPLCDVPPPACIAQGPAFKDSYIVCSRERDRQTDRQTDREREREREREKVKREKERAKEIKIPSDFTLIVSLRRSGSTIKSNLVSSQSSS